MNQLIKQLASDLIQVSTRNTASYIADKINASKAKKKRQRNN